MRRYSEDPTKATSPNDSTINVHKERNLERMDWASSKPRKAEKHEYFYYAEREILKEAAPAPPTLLAQQPPRLYSPRTHHTDTEKGKVTGTLKRGSVDIRSKKIRRGLFGPSSSTTDTLEDAPVLRKLVKAANNQTTKVTGNLRVEKMSYNSTESQKDGKPFFGIKFSASQNIAPETGRSTRDPVVLITVKPINTPENEVSSTSDSEISFTLQSYLASPTLSLTGSKDSSKDSCTFEGSPTSPLAAWRQNCAGPYLNSPPPVILANGVRVFRSAGKSVLLKNGTNAPATPSKLTAPNASTAARVKDIPGNIVSAKEEESCSETTDDQDSLLGLVLKDETDTAEEEESFTNNEDTDTASEDEFRRNAYYENSKPTVTIADPEQKYSTQLFSTTPRLTMLLNENSFESNENLSPTSLAKSKALAMEIGTLRDPYHPLNVKVIKDESKGTVSTLPSSSKTSSSTTLTIAKHTVATTPSSQLTRTSSNCEESTGTGSKTSSSSLEDESFGHLSQAVHQRCAVLSWLIKSEPYLCGNHSDDEWQFDIIL